MADAARRKCAAPCAEPASVSPCGDSQVPARGSRSPLAMRDISHPADVHSRAKSPAIGVFTSAGMSSAQGPTSQAERMQSALEVSVTRGLSTQARWDQLRSEAFRAPWLTAERERELLARAQRGERAASNELCRTHMRLVVQLASRYQRPGLAAEDLVGEGSIGLLEAIRRFDLSQPTRLSTYAGFWIRARVRSFAYAHRSIVPAPGTRAVRLARAQLTRVEHTLAQQLGRQPTREELASQLGVDEDDVASVLLTFGSKHLSSLDEPGGVAEPRDERCGPEEELAEREVTSMVEASVERALSSLGERDRQIIRAHFAEQASMAELGGELGITRQRVSQIVHRVRQRLSRDLARTACFG